MGLNINMVQLKVNDELKDFKQTYITYYLISHDKMIENIVFIQIKKIRNYKSILREILLQKLYSQDKHTLTMTVDLLGWNIFQYIAFRHGILFHT